MAKDDEREFRLRPQKPPARSERAAWASAYKILMHHARMITVGEHSSHLRLGCNLRTDVGGGEKGYQNGGGVVTCLGSRFE